MSSWAKEFRDFINRGNIVELAVAFVLGVAFAALVASFVDDIVMQIVAAIFGEPDFSSLTFDLGDSVIRYGAFLTQFGQLPDHRLRLVPHREGLQPIQALTG